MNAMARARSDLRLHMAGGATAYTGTFEAVRQIIFGSLKHDAHVRAYRAYHFYFEQQIRIARADAAVRAYLAEQGVTI